MKKILHMLLYALFVFNANAQIPKLEWAIGLGSSYENEEGSCITLSKSNNVYASGNFLGSVDFDPSSGFKHLITGAGNALFLTKSTSLKNLIWAKSITGTGTIYSSSIVTDDDDNVYLAGCFSAGNIDFDPSSNNTIISSQTNGWTTFIAKYDSSGNFKWVDCIAGAASLIPSDLHIDLKNNLFISGYFSGTADFDPSAAIANRKSGSVGNGWDMFFAKYDASGQFIWANAINSNSSSSFKGSIIMDNNSNLFITGHFIGTCDFDPSANTFNVTSNKFIPGGSNSSDIFIAKYDASGNFLWTKSLIGKYGGIANTIDLDKNNNVIIGGTFSSTLDFDPSSGTAILTADIASVFFAKYDSNGNYLWAKQIDATKSIEVNCIKTDKYNNIYLTGLFTSNSDFDPSSGEENLVPSSGLNNPSDCFIAKYDSDGTYSWAIQMGGDHNDVSKGLWIGPLNEIYVCGSFNTYADFDPSAGFYGLSSNGNKDIFIAKYSSLGNTSLYSFESIKTVYPNPAINELYISTYKPIEKTEVYSLAGMIQNTFFNKNTVDISNLNTGIYLVKIYYENGISIQKFIKQ